MRHKHRAMVTVSTSHVRFLSAIPTHVFGRSVQKNFVKTVRAVELLLGIPMEWYPALQGMPSNADMGARLANACTTNSSGLFNPESTVVKALTEAVSILPGIIQDLGLPLDFGSCQGHTALTTKPVVSSSAALKL